MEERDDSLEAEGSEVEGHHQRPAPIEDPGQRMPRGEESEEEAPEVEGHHQRPAPAEQHRPGPTEGSA